MDSSRTISEAKSAFLRTQVRILSETLAPPDDWKNYAVETEDGDLPEKVISDVLHKVNVATKQHHRVVYSSQAIHHVAQQIASLYWSSVNQETPSRTPFTEGVEKSTDLSRHMLPILWPRSTVFRILLTIRRNLIKVPHDVESLGASDDTNARYQQLRERLQTLDERRQQRQQRLDQLRHLQRLLDPFKDAQKNIQPNLVTRDGELIQELERMRMLAARVGGRISQQKQKIRLDDGERSDYLLPGSSSRLDSLLDME
ncbi:hypothetical protein N7539_002604 [Penicillium diatomitis]|uniref:Kinetochore protein fta4 n=1 Tax=Penicillium diatomitis TaxID=2819901 RepID=A0A9X0BZC9_9EURO|nr:uncharacterized protein N7539_002604 [Penicillium diatomitis]KAJ5491037.1 hypothetical protein N7539_002604 [Penicillium diatomitis]